MKKTSDIDILFALPLAEFTAARNALAARLKKEGQADEAARVKSMPKPSATAWAVNQLYWRFRKEMDRLFTVGDKVRAAQTGGSGDLRRLLDERRTIVSDLGRRAAEILREEDHAASPDAMRRIKITLESLAAFGRSNAESQAGRLTADLEPLGFDSLAAMLDGKKLQPAKVLQFRPAAEQKKAAQEEAAARAREKVKDAEKALTAARRDAKAAETAAAKANARAEALEKQKRELDARFSEAQDEARAAARESRNAEQAVAEAERALARARAAVE